MHLSFGATIGIIGGGQLGRMLAMAAARLGLKTCILEPGEDCPAAQVASIHLNFAYDDHAGLKKLAELSDVITYEFENVPVDSARFLEQHSRLYPPSKALEISQDRVTEKEFLFRCGAKTARYHKVGNPIDLDAALLDFGGQGILKTRRLGYDGKGQVLFDGNNNPDNGTTFSRLGGVGCVLEELISFECEISIIAARGIDGTFAAYDPAKNVHRDGILRTSTIPAGISAQITGEAVNITRTILNKLNYVGVIGVEFFVCEDGSLCVNEFAPRVHNSGHWTEAACTISQFEQHIRAIAGWPLGSTNRHSDCLMENIIGDETAGLELQSTNAPHLLHIYGKSEVREGRKMGHITRLTPTKG